MVSANPEKYITIYLNNTPIKVKDNIPLGAALYENGIYGFRKSFKYSRLRGLIVFDWWGPERIGLKDSLEGNPYLLKAREGLKIECDCDLELIPRIIWLSRRYFEVGFHNNSFFRSRLGWYIMKKLLNKILPYRYPPFEKTPPDHYPPPKEVKADVLVVGGGLAGLSAALASSSSGAKTVLIEAGDKLGGYLNLLNSSLNIRDGKKTYITDLIKILRKSHVYILTNVVFQGFLDDAIVGIDISTKQIIFFSAKSIILATGSREIPALFENNDLPRIILATGVLRLYKNYNVHLGKRGLVIGFNELGFKTAVELERNGIHVIMIDKNKLPDNQLAQEAKEASIELIDNVKGLKAFGKVKVNKIKVERGISPKFYKVDFIAMSPYTNPSLELPGQIQLKMAFDSRLGGFIPLHSIDGLSEKEGIFIAGSLGGIMPKEACHYLSQAVGFKAAEYSISHSLDEEYEYSISRGIEYFNELDSRRFEAYKKLTSSYENRSIYSYLDEEDINTWYEGDYSAEFVCSCTDVTVADLIRMYNDAKIWRMELVKRYSGLGTGGCQGRGCVFNTVFILSKISGKDPIEIGRFRSRFPVIPISLESLAGVKL